MSIEIEVGDLFYHRIYEEIGLVLRLTPTIENNLGIVYLFEHSFRKGQICADWLLSYQEVDNRVFE